MRLMQLAPTDGVDRRADLRVAGCAEQNPLDRLLR